MIPGERLQKYLGCNPSESGASGPKQGEFAQICLSLTAHRCEG